jgi:hypothetical protein
MHAAWRIRAARREQPTRRSSVDLQGGLHGRSTV